MGRAIDALITFRFLKLLVTPFNKTKAYELGIIDERGKNLIKGKDLTTFEQKNAYTITEFVDKLAQWKIKKST